MNQNFQFQKKKKKQLHAVVFCRSLLLVPLLARSQPNPKKSERFGVGVYLLSSLKSLSWILTFHNFIYRHIKRIGQKFVCMVATRGQHILLQRRSAFIEYINPYNLLTDCHKASYQKTTNQTWKTCCYTHPSLFFSSLQ